MYTAITEQEAIKGVEVDFYLNPKDKAPTLKTTIQETDWDGRGRLYVLVTGVDDWFLFYHFAKSTSTIRYGCAITNPLDSLHATKGY